MRRVGSLLLVLSSLLGCAEARAADVPDEFLDFSVMNGLSAPTNFDFLPDGRLLLVERKTGRVRMVVGEAMGPVDPVGTIADVETTGPEQGLLGIAVDPRWPAKPYIYVLHSVASGPNLRLSRYALAGDLDGTDDDSLSIVANSRRDILADLPDDYPLHNGGTVEFGPDGLLYVAVGDDGVPCSAPDIHQLRGKILRLNVTAVPDGPGPTPSYQSLAAPGNPYASDPDPRARLVWQRGLRNPFSFDFDASTGAVVIGDVGEAGFEEVDLADSGGMNFGWPLYEGPGVYAYPCVYSDSGAIAPPATWYQRPRPEEPAAVMIGGVYRAPEGAPYAFPAAYEGSVFVFDVYTGELRRFERDGSALVPAPPVAGQPTPGAWATGLDYPSRMRVGPDGGLWYLEGNSGVRCIRWVGPPVDAGNAPGAARLTVSAFPVPARGAVTVEYRLPAPGPSAVRIVDAAGRRVRALASGDAADGGTWRARWDGRDDAGRAAPPGLYFAVVRHRGEDAVRRLVLLP